MKKIILFSLIALIFSSCHESLENRAAREAKEYTQKFCPTPVTNYTRTDSVTFDKSTKTYHYYQTLTGRMDNAQLINAHRAEIKSQLLKLIIESTTITAYKQAGFNFAYTCHSQKSPTTVLFDVIYTKKDYNP